MEYLKQSKMEQKGLEILILILFTIYSLVIFVVAIHKEWAGWIPAVFLTGVFFAWSITLAKYKNFRARAILITVAMELNFLLYATNTKDIEMVISTFLVYMIFVAFYGLTEPLKITMLAAAFMVFYYIFINPLAGSLSSYRIERLYPLVSNAILLETVVYIWVKQRSANMDRMIQILEALMDAERSKDDFLSNVSHEIRTPINTICGMSEMALREREFDKLQSEVFNIQTAGRNLMSLVSDILDFSQLQSGQMELEDEEYNITSTVNDVINMSMAKKMEKNIELIVDCDADLPNCLRGDEKKIRRVMMNLIDNAIKFTNEGCVSLIIEGRREYYGLNLSVTVRDTGIGMDQKGLEKLFVSFSQIDSKRNRQESGMGLGLAISKILIQKMGGTISVKSQPGKGSEIRFVIPQKIVDETPIAQVAHRQDIDAAVYIDMEQFEMLAIRDEYTLNIRHIVEQLRVKCHVCRNLAELKRRHENQHFTHVFISLVEYQSDPSYFDALAKQTTLVLVIDQFDDKKVDNQDLLRLYKPFYILPVVSVLNGSRDYAGGAKLTRKGKFIAPEAKILVVDDNMMNVRVIEGLLKEYQVQVVHALSGQEALKKIETKDYDFVFMDHMMPEMDGIETLHRLRQKSGRYYQQIPILALTANVAPGNREMFLAEGFADFVTKPIEISVLERVLLRTLPSEKIQDSPVESSRKAQRVDAQAESGRKVQRVDAQAESSQKMHSLDSGQPKKMSEKASGEAEFVVGELNVEHGMLYCGNRECFLQIAHSCCEEAAAKHQELQRLFEEEDWENYVIKVHAMKSTLKSIGADEVSNQAKALEMAGKNADYEQILRDHTALLEGYRRVMDGVSASPLVFEEAPYQIQWIVADMSAETEEVASANLPELSDDEFVHQIYELENIMFDFDEEAMLSIINTLEKYQYRGRALQTELAAVKRKLQMSDYMSAVETLREIYQNLQKGGDAS